MITFTEQSMLEFTEGGIMKRTFLTIVVLSVVAGLVYIAGCSNDNKSTTSSTTKPMGDTLDPVFIGANQALEGAKDSLPAALGAMVGGLWGVVDSMGALKSEKPLGAMQPDSVWFNSDNNYWYALEETSDIYYRYQIDSLQFMHGNTAVQWPDTNLLTRINGGVYAVVTGGILDKALVGDTVFKYTFQGSMSGEAGSIAHYGDVAISGSGNIYIDFLPAKDASDLSCGYEIDDNYQINHVQLNLITVFELDGCPVSGNVTHNAGLTLACTGDTTFANTDNWYLQESFANDSTYYILENSVHRWETSEACSDSIQ
jgi:hypothetical protein